MKVGDIIAATVLSKTAPGIILKLLYGECDEIRCVPDIGIKVSLLLYLKLFVLMVLIRL